MRDELSRKARLHHIPSARTEHQKLFEIYGSTRQPNVCAENLCLANLRANPSEIPIDNWKQRIKKWTEIMDQPVNRRRNLTIRESNEENKARKTVFRDLQKDIEDARVRLKRTEDAKKKKRAIHKSVVAGRTIFHPNLDALKTKIALSPYLTKPDCPYSGETLYLSEIMESKARARALNATDSFVLDISAIDIDKRFEDAMSFNFEYESRKLDKRKELSKRAHSPTTEPLPLFQSNRRYEFPANRNEETDIFVCLYSPTPNNIPPETVRDTNAKMKGFEDRMKGYSKHLKNVSDEMMQSQTSLDNEYSNDSEPPPALERMKLLENGNDAAASSSFQLVQSLQVTNYPTIMADLSGSFEDIFASLSLEKSELPSASNDRDFPLSPSLSVTSHHPGSCSKSRARLQRDLALSSTVYLSDSENSAHQVDEANKRSAAACAPNHSNSGVAENIESEKMRRECSENSTCNVNPVSNSIITSIVKSNSEHRLFVDCSSPTLLEMHETTQPRRKMTTQTFLKGLGKVFEKQRLLQEIKPVRSRGRPASATVGGVIRPTAGLSPAIATALPKTKAAPLRPSSASTPAIKNSKKMSALGKAFSERNILEWKDDIAPLVTRKILKLNDTSR